MGFPDVLPAKPSWWTCVLEEGHFSVLFSIKLAAHKVSLPIPMEQGALPGVVLDVPHCLVLLRYILFLMSPVRSIVCLCREMVTLVELCKVSEIGFPHKSGECF